MLKEVGIYIQGVTDGADVFIDGEKIDKTECEGHCGVFVTQLEIQQEHTLRIVSESFGKNAGCMPSLSFFDGSPNTKILTQLVCLKHNFKDFDVEYRIKINPQAKEPKLYFCVQKKSIKSYFFTQWTYLLPKKEEKSDCSVVTEKIFLLKKSQAFFLAAVHLMWLLVFYFGLLAFSVYLMNSNTDVQFQKEQLLHLTFNEPGYPYLAVMAFIAVKFVVNFISYLRFAFFAVRNRTFIK